MRKARGIALGVAALLAGASPAATAATLDLQGHRGARGLAPENTLAAFATALGIGVSTLEFDLGLSADGIVVISHGSRLSPDLTRGPGGAWLEGVGPALRTLTRAEIARYDVGRLRPGSRYARRFPAQQAVDGARIPTLAEVVALTRAAGNARVRFNVETKIDPERPRDTAGVDTFVDAVLDVLRAEGVVARTTLQSFDWRTLRRSQALEPALRTVCLSAEQDWLDNIRRAGPGPSPWTAGLDIADHDGSLPRLVRSAGCAIWSPYYRELTAGLLAEAHALGLTVVVWTVNEATDMDALIALGVDGIISDYPDRLRAAARRAGLPLPAPTPVVAP